VLLVTGKGTGKKRKYRFEAAGIALPIATEIEIEQVIADLSDATHSDRFRSLPRGWFHMPELRRELVWNITDRGNGSEAAETTRDAPTQSPDAS
jgi:hypothetical protein